MISMDGGGPGPENGPPGAYRAPRAFDGMSVRPGGALILVDGRRIVAVQPATAAIPSGYDEVACPAPPYFPG